MTTILTRSDMRAALEHVEEAMGHIARAIDRLAAPEDAGEYEDDLTAQMSELVEVERQLADWCAPSIRLRQRLPPTDL
jgi:hypothetical protein